MNVVFFDGYCGLCNSSVDLVMKLDKNRKFRFSPLQSEYAATQLTPVETKNLESVTVLINGQKYRKSRAVIAVLKELGGMWGPVAAVMKIIPTSLMDKAYDLVAANRYKLFGKKDTCRLPSPEERALFIM